MQCNVTYVTHVMVNGMVLLLHIAYHTVDGRNPAPVDSWIIPLFIAFQHVSTILLVVQDFATTHRIINH